MDIEDTFTKEQIPEAKSKDLNTGCERPRLSRLPTYYKPEWQSALAREEEDGCCRIAVPLTLTDTAG